MIGKTTLLALLLSTGLAGAALAQTATPGKMESTAKGQILTNGKGRTLYTFDKDSTGKSACNATCATLWPPFLASSDATASGNWSVITRSNGSKQWAYDGKPLYTWIKDKKPGDMTGNGVKNVWHTAHP
jgi:predicted lipoprotein with Yx(FWY)xxD motif